jgi:tRNA nucleotidyltransferase (CCA-adding enzyme)
MKPVSELVKFIPELLELTKISQKMYPQADLYIVGGWVRDMLLGIPSNDIDLVIESKLTDSELIGLLNQYGEVVVGKTGDVLLGKNFSVFRWWFDGSMYEVARTRTEVGGGASTNTVVNTNNVSIYDDLHRRDVTINAIAFRLRDFEVIDPLDGIECVSIKILWQCSWSFAESIERPLRLAVLKSKLGPEWVIGDNLLQMCKNMSNWAGVSLIHAEAEERKLSAIPKDQLWHQFSKAMSNPHPSQFLRTLKEMWWLELFPDLNALVGCPQHPEHHPEGDAFEHTCFVMDEAADIARREGFNKDETILLVLSALCHDLGKPATTKMREVRGEMKWTSYRHEIVGVDVTEQFLSFIGCPKDISKKVQKLVEHHMFQVSRKQQNVYKSARWLLYTFDNDVRFIKALVEADQSGRPPRPKGLGEHATAIFNAVEEIGEFHPIVTGKFLNDLGVFATKNNGKQFGQIIKSCLNAQIDGKIIGEETALHHLRKMHVIKENKDANLL